MIDTPDRCFKTPPSRWESHDAQAKPDDGHDVAYVFETNGGPLAGTGRVREHAPSLFCSEFLGIVMCETVGPHHATKVL